MTYDIPRAAGIKRLPSTATRMGIEGT
jgi:hypothetical protein